MCHSNPSLLVPFSYSLIVGGDLPAVCHVHADQIALVKARWLSTQEIVDHRPSMATWSQSEKAVQIRHFYVQVTNWHFDNCSSERMLKTT